MAQRIWQIGLVGIVMLCMLIVAAQQSDNHGEILFPASAGDSVYIRTHDGTRILIDTGNDAPALLSLLAHHQPLFATGVADILILTHPGVAWHGGRAALIQRGIGEVWVLGRQRACIPPPPCRTDDFCAWDTRHMKKRSSTVHSEIRA